MLFHRRARVVVLGLACSFGHEDCLKEASRRFSEWLTAPNTTLSQDLRGLVYKFGKIARYLNFDDSLTSHLIVGMKAGTPTEWYALWDRFVKESDASEKLKLLSGLASIKDATLLNR